MTEGLAAGNDAVAGIKTVCTVTFLAIIYKSCPWERHERAEGREERLNENWTGQEWEKVVEGWEKKQLRKKIPNVAQTEG